MYCEGEHKSAREVRGCWERAQRETEVDQIRAHGLAGAGKSGAPPDKAKVADDLRDRQTRSEKALGNALAGLKQWAFYAQVPLHGYVVDFYAPEIMLAVEVDGASHDRRETADGLRDDVLRAEGIDVLRFPVGQVVDDIDAVLRKIKKRARKRPRTGALLGERELDYFLFRHGPEALVDDEPDRVPPIQQVQPDILKMKLHCFDCKRDFIAPIVPSPLCRENRSHKVQAYCHRCRQPGRMARPPICNACRDVADVARRSAGPGARSPTGELPQARRGSAWKG